MFRISVAPVCLVLSFVCISSPVGAQQRPSLGALAREADARRPDPSPSSAHAAPATAPIAGRWKSEQEWIVSDVGSAIANIAAAANGARDAGAINARAASGPGGATTLEITDHLWQPAAYVPMARAALGSGQGMCRTVESPLIGALLEPSPEIIQKQNQRISARLTDDMRCAEAHEEAALLVGVFALREAAGVFSDTRRLISRTTAHLAVADALRSQMQPPQATVANRPVRVLADVVQLTLIGRQRTALSRLQALGTLGGDLDLQAWDRALRIRNTSDWRLLGQPRRATLFEQLSWFRAVRGRIGEAAALARHDSLQDPIPVVDWGRLIMEPALGPGVVAGNRFGAESVSRELEDAARVRAGLFPAAPLTGEALLESLNVEPQAGPAGPNGIVVLDWGTWAAAAQRHLMMAINAYDTHLDTMLGLPDEAAEFRASLRSSLSSLRLFPLVAISLSGTPAEDRGALLAAARLARTHPELLSDWMWKCLLMKEPTAPASTTWFAPFFPYGTLYDLDHRPFAPYGRPRFRPEQIADFRVEAPYSRTLAEEATRALGPKPSAAALAPVYGEMASYDSGFAERLANTFWDNAPEYAKRMEALTEMDVDSREVLAEYLVDRGKAADAVRHYERWLAETQSDIDVATSVDWLVRHYYETGEQAKATAVAARAAETYAYGGLLVRARLHEWRGELAEAERLLDAGRKRYGNLEDSNSVPDLLAFYLRRARKGPAVETLMSSIFPAGMKRVTAAALTGTPGAGIRITYTGETGKQNGLAVGDVVVAVDGIEVQDLRQYRVARNVAQDPVVRMTVWRAGRYVEVPARVRFGWVYGRFENYPAR